MECCRPCSDQWSCKVWGMRGNVDTAAGWSGSPSCWSPRQPSCWHWLLSAGNSRQSTCEMHSTAALLLSSSMAAMAVHIAERILQCWGSCARHRLCGKVHCCRTAASVPRVFHRHNAQQTTQRVISKLTTTWLDTTSTASRAWCKGPKWTATDVSRVTKWPNSCE